MANNLLTTDCTGCNPVSTHIMKDLNKFIWLGCECHAPSSVCALEPHGHAELVCKHCFEQHSWCCLSPTPFSSRVALSAMLTYVPMPAQVYWFHQYGCRHPASLPSFQLVSFLKHGRQYFAKFFEQFCYVVLVASGLDADGDGREQMGKRVSSSFGWAAWT